MSHPCSGMFCALKLRSYAWQVLRGKSNYTWEWGSWALPFPTGVIHRKSDHVAAPRCSLLPSLMFPPQHHSLLFSISKDNTWTRSLISHVRVFRLFRGSRLRQPWLPGTPMQSSISHAMYWGLEKSTSMSFSKHPTINVQLRNFYS